MTTNTENKTWMHNLWTNGQVKNTRIAGNLKTKGERNKTSDEYKLVMSIL